MRRLNGGHAAHRDRLTVEECAATALRIGNFAVDRRTRDTQHNLTFVHQGDLRGKHRILANKGLRAVDGIHYPQEFRILAMQSCFLAVKAMRGKARLYNFANRHFTAYIGFGDRRFVRLDADFNIALIQ